MLSFYHPQPLYTVYPGGYSPRYSPSYSSYPSSPHPLVDPGMRYRRAFAEYLAVEEEEARLRTRVEEALRRQKWARLLQAEIVRERRELQVRELERALAKTLFPAAAPWKDHRSLRGIAPVIPQNSDQPPIDPLVTSSLHANALGSPESSRDFSADKAQPQNDAKANTSDNQAPRFTSSERVEEFVPNLESLLRERLQKAVGDGDEEVQDVARDILLRHLAPVTGVSAPPASAAPSTTRENTYSMHPTDGADLYRSDALQGSAAEAAKESFKAHRAGVAEGDQCPASAPPFESDLSPLKVIQDVRSALTKLSSGFAFPPSLDFSDDEPDGLAYTPTNAPVRVYEHALDNLLVQLDAVETDGDEEVRVVRRAAVKEVEKAIEDVERRISEARKGAKPGSDVTPAQGDLAEDKDEQVIYADASVDDDNRPEANGHSPSISKDSLDLVPSTPDVSSLPNSEVVLLPLDATLTNSEPKPEDGVLGDQSSSPGLESIPQTAAVATATVTPPGQSPVPTGDPQESKYEASTDQTKSTSLKPSLSATPLETPTTVILGAIAPSSTPVSYILPSPVNPEDMLAAFDHDLLSLSQGPESEGDPISVDADDEREWIEVNVEP